MKHYAGLDVSLRDTSICIVDDEGTIVREGSTETEPASIARFLEPFRGTLVRSGLETGPLSSWLWEALEAQGFRTFCMEAGHASKVLRAQLNKTDRNDARGLAQIIRSGWFKSVHVKSRNSQRMRTLINNRAHVVNKKKDIENQIRGTLASFGLKMGPISTLRFDQRVRDLTSDDQMLFDFVEPLLIVRDVMLKQLKALHKMVLQHARNDDVCRRLMTVPGVGVITAVTFRATIDQPERFRRSRDVGAHLGLTPRKYASGQIDYNRGITKSGDPMMRSYLFEAAQSLMRRVAKTNSIKEWGMQLAKRTSMRNALVAVARKLAVVLHRIWIDGSEFIAAPREEHLLQAA